jgi:hypothetical protein
MFRYFCLLAVALALLAAKPGSAQELNAGPGTPAFTKVPELSDGFRLLYEQRFSEARAKFSDWELHHPDEPFGEVAVAATYLYEEFYADHVLSSDFFLDDKKFLHGIDGKPNRERMNNFLGALTRTREISKRRLKQNPKDPEALFGLTLAAGMESDADAILEKKQLDGLKRMKEANEYAKELLAVQPDANDAYIALGTANFIIGSLNPGYRFALWFGGIHGDKKLGMQQLQITVDRGGYLKPFAKIMLALGARREKQPALAQKLLRELSEEFPASELFAAEYAKAMGRPTPSVITR